MIKNINGFVPILIVVILGFVAVIGYLVLKPTIPYSEPTPTTSAEESTENWKTFRDSRFLFMFKYPPNWVPIPDHSLGSIEIKNENNELIISIRSYNPSLVGASYCEGNPQDERCETLVTESGISVTIDWEFNGKAIAILDGTSVTLEKVTPLTERVFRQTLSTFRFLDGVPSVNCTEVQDYGELSFSQMICGGYQCTNKTTKEECETADVAEIVEENQLVSGQDGITDCVWLEEVDSNTKCWSKYNPPPLPSE